MMKGLSGKRVLVTGASSGIGQAIAIRMAQEGCQVALNYHDNLLGAEETERRIRENLGLQADEPAPAITVYGDVGDEASILSMFSDVFNRLGGLDVLVNNAGILSPRKGDWHATADLDRVLTVNLRGAMLCAREAINHFLAQGRPGVVINVSSVHEVIPNTECAPYAISKAGMGGMTRTLALQFAERGIRVNGIGPGAINTPMNADWMADPVQRKAFEDYIPMKRIGQPEEMAAVAAFLASDEASYMTGQTLFADGGLMIYPEYNRF